jgi:hypothetical protein
MGVSASRIWTEICSIESEYNRYKMVNTVLTSPEIVSAARKAGVYDTVQQWLSEANRGNLQRFPFASQSRFQPQQQYHPQQQYQQQYQQPYQQQYQQQQPQQPQPQQLVVHKAAKAINFFEECLELLGIDDTNGITIDSLKSGYRNAARVAHPDKGGSKEAFDAVTRAYNHVKDILIRINPSMSNEDKAKLSAPVTMETAVASRRELNTQLEDSTSRGPPIMLSAKKLDMGVFNKLFEENRLPDPARDTGYGDWLSSGSGPAEPVSDPRLKGKFTPQTFETVFRERVSHQTTSDAIVKRLEPDALTTTVGTELGGDSSNFTAPIGAETQFMDLKEAYTSGSTRFQEVADVQVGTGRTVKSVDEAKRIRDAEMARVDPDEKSKIAAAAAALEERERRRRIRLAQEDAAQNDWASALRNRLYVTNK